ncbi:serine hydrolase [uncultured Aliiroseovarius sp.]|uniref:serine hydrolase n=1 Tax=uncultured Aliiroseovarius sp. TaxID=1658783 RepID=UPI0025918231|nr:serine hydrolase [uncultured Aliiroseovarius sp.]
MTRSTGISAGRRAIPGAFLGAAAALFAANTALHAQSALPEFALPDPAVSPARATVLPVPQDRIANAVASLDGLAQDLLDRTGVPGLAVAVVQGQDTLLMRGWGQRAEGGQAEGGQAEVDADTVFLLASLSKSVGATVVATQVANGAVSWDDPVRDYLPWFDLGDHWVSDHVTIGDLYAHRSGLPDHAGDDLEDVGYGRRAVLERLGQLPMGRFRADYAYTNFGLTAAAEAVATAAGTDWASLSERALYAPLGMGATSSRHADYMARGNRAAAHVPRADGFAVADLRQPDAQSPAGGVSSSARDMAQWMKLVLSGGRRDGAQLIAPGALLPALSPQAITGRPADAADRTGSYGYGVGIGVRPSGRVMLSHSGAFALGAATAYAMLPDLKLGIVVLTNASPTGLPEALAASFLDRVEFGADQRDWLAAYGPRIAPLSAPAGALVGTSPPQQPAAARPPDAYAGRYDSAYFGAAEVRKTADGLLLEVGPAPQRLPLSHWDGNRFVAFPVTENQPEGSVSQVVFTIGADGQADMVTVEHLNDAGLGGFRRP